MKIKNNDLFSNEQLSRWLHQFSNQFNTGVAILDTVSPSFPILHCNEGFSEITGYSVTELTGQTLSILLGPKSDLSLAKQMELDLSSFAPINTVIYHYHKDGTGFWNELIGQPIFNLSGEIKAYFIYIKDISTSIHEKLLSNLEHELYAKIENSFPLQDILVKISEETKLLFPNTIYCAISLEQNQQYIIHGEISLEILKLHLENVNNINPVIDNNIRIYENLQDQSHSSDYTEVLKSYKIQSSLSKPIYTHNNQLLGHFYLFFKENIVQRNAVLNFINTISPILSLAIKYDNSQQQLAKLTNYDKNTGLPNDDYFMKVLTRWIEEGKQGLISLVQPNEISTIIDYYGRKAGDELLSQIADRLKTDNYLKNEIIGRISNSTLVVASEMSLKLLKKYEARVKKHSSNPYLIGNREIEITHKIGIAPFGNGLSAEDCVRRADLALTKSHLNMGPTISIFEEERDEELRIEMDVLSELAKGLREGEFFIHLQPKINLQTNEIESFEALARWHSPKLGMVSPAVFIPVAESSGRIRDIDNKVITLVLEWLQKRKANNQKLYPVAVNISPVHFYHEFFVDDITKLVSSYNIDPVLIKLEVTESVELVDFLKAKNILARLNSHGFETSIDDFGVGFSSLSYLQQLPFSEIKIDRSFINAMNESGMLAVVHTIIQLAGNLNMSSVAEGIETIEQLETLKKMGCRTGQGFYFNRPMPIEEVEKIID